MQYDVIPRGILSQAIIDNPTATAEEIQKVLKKKATLLGCVQLKQ